MNIVGTILIFCTQIYKKSATMNSFWHPLSHAIPFYFSLYSIAI